MTTRITMCPRGHRREIAEADGMTWIIDPLCPPYQRFFMPLLKAVEGCDYCAALIERRRPAKAKRPGES